MCVCACACVCVLMSGKYILKYMCTNTLLYIICTSPHLDGCWKIYEPWSVACEPPCEPMCFNMFQWMCHG